MIDNPEQDKDLQLLDRALRDRDSSLSLYDYRGHPTLQLMAHHPQSHPLYRDGFNDRARGLVTENGGHIHFDHGDGFVAIFPDEGKRTDFVFAFAAAAKNEFTAERCGIRREHDMLKFGAYGP